MNNEETTNQSQEPVETPSETPAPSLDDIASQFSVEKEANNFQAQPAPQAPAQPQYQPQQNYYDQTQAPQNFESQIPDPIYDSEGYARYMQNQANQSRQSMDMLQQIASKIDNYEKQVAQQQIESDLAKAVTRVNEKLNVEPDMAEYALEMEHRKNPAFQNLSKHLM